MSNYPMLQWAQDLFPIARSLTGQGVRDTFQYLRALHPEINLHTFKTGEHVFDWEIPKEWRIDDCYIEHLASGRRFAEFSKNNLHVLGYATPVDQVMSREALCDHLYTQPDQPDLIPYVTSYYKERWGFCLSENEKNTLPDGDYRVVIDSALFEGELILGDAKIQGRKDEEILFSSYICHPSMANNELSGPVLMAALMRLVKSLGTPEYSYRFVFVPETIGAVAYMSRHLEEMQKNVVCGFNLSCVGDERAYSHVESRYANTLADKALRSALFALDAVKTYSYLQRGSDERQYGAPGVDLPLCGFCRSKYGEYLEYHTNADNFDLVTQAGLEGSFDVMRNIITAFETGLYPKVQVLGEPQLGKRGLYPTLSQKGAYANIRTRMDFLAYADGTNTLFDISRLINAPVDVVIGEAQIMKKHGLVICAHTAIG